MIMLNKYSNKFKHIIGSYYLTNQGLKDRAQYLAPESFSNLEVKPPPLSGFPYTVHSVG